jgi:hypothetical protein
VFLFRFRLERIPKESFPRWRLRRGSPSRQAFRLSRRDTPILIYRVERLETTTAALRARGWVPESGPFEIPNGPCCTFRDPTGVRFAIYENQRPEVDHEFAGRFDARN